MTKYSEDLAEHFANEQINKWTMDAEFGRNKEMAASIIDVARDGIDDAHQDKITDQEILMVVNCETPSKYADKWSFAPFFWHEAEKWLQEKAMAYVDENWKELTE